MGTVLRPRATIGWITVGVCLALAQPPAQAQEKHILRGEIVNPARYVLDGGRGRDLEDETLEAVDSGQTLALLEDGSSALYLLLSDDPREDPNRLAYDYLNQSVELIGRVYARGGLVGVVPEQISPLEPDAPAAAPEPLPAELPVPQPLDADGGVEP